MSRLAITMIVAASWAAPLALTTSLSAQTQAQAPVQEAMPSAPRAPAAVTAPGDIAPAINKLGDLDFPTRMNAARVVRRAPAAQAVPSLIEAVDTHKDGYVRFKALVLLAGFNDPRTKDVMARAMRDPNDRLREVAFAYFEHNPDPSMSGELLAALEREQGEFVRPAVVRALASHAGDQKVREALLRDVTRGEDFFRSVVIEALGDHRAAYALDAITGVANLEGPLQDDAAVALGKIGDKRSLETLAKLQRSAPRATQPAIAAGICLLGVNCETHQRYLAEALTFTDKNPGYQELLRAAANGLGALAVFGRAEAFAPLFDIGIPSQDPARAAIALALGSAAVRNPLVMMSALEKRTDIDAAVELLRDGFDMLEEDFEEEMFFTSVRRAYWQAAEGAPRRKLVETLIQKLEF